VLGFSFRRQIGDEPFGHATGGAIEWVPTLRRVRQPSARALAEKQMTTNMGTADRAFRTVIAIAVVALYLTGRISGTLALLGAFATVFLVTSFAGVCPLYAPLGISTRR
jgi:hypothetical protein